MADTITILRARGRRLCKTITADGGVRGYDSARTFDMFKLEVSSLDDLHAILADLAGQRDRCVVRGAIADPSRTRGVRRLLHADPETGEQPTLRDVPRRWVAVDLDSVPLPTYINRESLFECGMEISSRLPREFRGCGFIVQATTQHCIAEGARLRLWFWLDRAVTGSELRQWFSGCAVDFSAFTPAQVCYTAAPVFENGSDFLQRRLELMPGPGAVRVPAPEALRPPPPPPPRPMPTTETPAARDRYAWCALRNAATRLAQAAEGSRHAQLLAEARGLARFVPSGALQESEIIATLTGAAQAAGKTDPREISAALAWGFAHASSVPIAKEPRA